ncbi:MAG TPA: hypothetical protein VG322_08315 [Candidatus Acidoferrales bacterium]|nr:hypothetical protein [Candidatus Acidoferrales bacterium]
MARRMRCLLVRAINMNIYQEAANNAKESQAEEFSEKRLWAAVLLQALEDWSSNNSRHREEADRFFFGCPEDFARVCRGAGLAPTGVLARLRRMKETAPRRPTFPFHRAA